MGVTEPPTSMQHPGSTGCTLSPNGPPANSLGGCSPRCWPRTQDGSCTGSLSRGEGEVPHREHPQLSSDSSSERFLTRSQRWGRGDVGGTCRKSKPFRPGSHLESMSPSTEVAWESDSTKNKAEAEGPGLTPSLGLHEGIWIRTWPCLCWCR